MKVTTTTPLDVEASSRDGKLEPTTHISIFDKAHEKSIEAKESNSVFRLPNQGLHDSTKFKCLPVTDYGKIITQ